MSEFFPNMNICHKHYTIHGQDECPICTLTAERDQLKSRVSELEAERREWLCQSCHIVYTPEELVRTEGVFPRCPKCDEIVTYKDAYDRKVLRDKCNKLEEELCREFLYHEEMLDEKNDRIRELRMERDALQSRKVAVQGERDRYREALKEIAKQCEGYASCGYCARFTDEQMTNPLRCEIWLALKALEGGKDE